jgi:hypothetical protein
MTSPNPEDDKNKDKPSIKHDSTAVKDDQRARETASLHDNPSLPANTAPGHDEHCAAEERYWKRQVFWQATGAIATIFAFAAAALYVCYAKQQVGEMKQSVDNAETQFEAAQRPWLGLGTVNIDQPLSPAQTMLISASVPNGGRSPGLHTVAYGHLELRFASEILADQSVQPQCNMPEPKWSKTTESSGGSLVLPSANPGSESMKLFWDSPALNQDEVDSIQTTGSILQQLTDPPTKYQASNLPRHGLYLTGCIDYFDGSLKGHRTYFCEAYWPKGRPGGLFYFCPRGNSAD